MINIGSRRECFFDDHLLDSEKSSVSIVAHKPNIEEIVMTFDSPWESNGCAYINFFYDSDINKYRIYYLSRESVEHTIIDSIKEQMRVCYAESSDGIHIEKPSLGICDYNGSGDNNIILDLTVAAYYDNFFVFKDENPLCAPEEKYKGISEYQHELYSYVSSDGIHFKRDRRITNEGSFDSLNTAHWDADKKIYRCYFRSFHVPGDFDGKDEFHNTPRAIPTEERAKRIRDIRYIESKDFKNWSEQKLVRYSGDEDYPTYTNCIMPYYRAPHMLIGFPTRYIHRQEWTKAFDNLCAKEARLERMKVSERYGLAVTDCAFMCSRDGVNFERYNAFFTPGAENDNNWVYGDCYAALGFALTESKLSPSADKQISMFCLEGGWLNRRYLRRYSIRQDGFCSIHADTKEEVAVTKPFIFKGNALYANMATSAAGYVYFELKTTDGEETKSCEMFGDKIDKLICFEKGLQSFCGKEVVLTMRLCEADVYSIKFEDKQDSGI